MEQHNLPKQQIQTYQVDQLPKQNQINNLERIKVKPKNKIEYETFQTQQNNNNDLIFAFEDNQGECEEEYNESQPQKMVDYYFPDESVQKADDQPKNPEIAIAPFSPHQVVNVENQFQPPINPLKQKNTLVIERILFFPQKFYLYNQKKNLLVCSRKKLFDINSLYYFFSDANMESTKNTNYLGYMTSNYTSNQYRLFSADHFPIASFGFAIKKNTPGQITVHINKKAKDTKKPIIEKWINQRQSLYTLFNRQPQKNPITGKFSTRLEGLAKEPSCKNCAIIFDDLPSLIMGKQKQKNYNLHYGQPWTDLIALAFAISNYQQKDIQE